MNEVLMYAKMAIIFCISYLGYFLGGFDKMMVTLIIFMVVDYISGIIKAIYKKKLCSKVGFKGIAKKMVILLIVGTINLLGIALGINELRYVVIAFYLANEGISIIENANSIGVPIPKKITEVLINLKEGD